MEKNWLITLFAVAVLGLLALDLGLFHKRDREIKFREALAWSTFWVLLALGFNALIWVNLGKEQALTFLTGYLVEMSLSVDNLFVFLLIFSAFRVPTRLQHRVLFWGILGALLMRAVCIGAGVVALQRFEWLTYVFGLILIYGGYKAATDKEEDYDPSKGPVVRFVQKILPVTHEFHGEHFFVKLKAPRGGTRWTATPLFLALIVVEISDLIFAVDSIPAVLAITTDPFLVYTSNIFAILGLRSIYFALARVVDLFRYLKVGLSIVLVFIGLKIMLHKVVHIPVGASLGIIVFTLAMSILASLVIQGPDSSAPRKKRQH
ncbi:MAG: hypothetical protein RIQ81_1088 [Pseudomonadota bacterium]